MTKDEALKLALEALEDLGMKHFESTGEVLYKDTFTAIKEALAQPEPQYVAFMDVPQRTWVGLTDDDKVLIKHDANFNQFMTAGEYADRVQQLTEARLKDLNT